ncbi:cytidylyltransferase domain-containing protein, partial [Helicobacter typhlonius]
MIIIPARLESTRFPKKVLCDIGGLPMVVRTALNAQQVDSVVVA